MNRVRQIQRLSERDLQAQHFQREATWHADYLDTAYVYFGGLASELSEGDVAVIFSQYGHPTFVRLIRDAETGRSRGYGFVKYADQRSTDLAVDNLCGATILGRVMVVDHARYTRRSRESNELDPIEQRVNWHGKDTLERYSESTSDVNSSHSFSRSPRRSRHNSSFVRKPTRDSHRSNRVRYSRRSRSPSV